MLSESNVNEIARTLQKKLEHNEFKRTIESILFQARRPVFIREISKIFRRTSDEKIKKAIYEIQDEYNLFNTILKIVEYTGERFELVAKREIVNVIDKFTMGDLFSQEELKILAYIIHNPKSKKREMASKLGKSIYKHIKNLTKKGFIEGDANYISLSSQFFDYFELKDHSVENLKKNLLSILSGN